MMTFSLLFLVLVVVVASTAAVAILRLTRNRTGSLEGARDVAWELGKISQQLDALRDQMASVEDETARLHERVDFTERLLEAPRAEPEKADPPGES